MGRKKTQEEKEHKQKNNKQLKHGDAKMDKGIR
jgi:hypothetical protein